MQLRQENTPSLLGEQQHEECGKLQQKKYNNLVVFWVIYTTNTKKLGNSK